MWFRSRGTRNRLDAIDWDYRARSIAVTTLDRSYPANFHIKADWDHIYWECQLIFIVYLEFYSPMPPMGLDRQRQGCDLPLWQILFRSPFNFGRCPEWLSLEAADERLSFPDNSNEIWRERLILSINLNLLTFGYQQNSSSIMNLDYPFQDIWWIRNEYCEPKCTVEVKLDDDEFLVSMGDWPKPRDHWFWGPGGDPDESAEKYPHKHRNGGMGKKEGWDPGFGGELDARGPCHSIHTTSMCQGYQSKRSQGHL